MGFFNNHPLLCPLCALELIKATIPQMRLMPCGVDKYHFDTFSERNNICRLGVSEIFQAVIVLLLTKSQFGCLKPLICWPHSCLIPLLCRLFLCFSFSVSL